MTLSHVRSVFRLLFEVRDLGASPINWRSHMISRLMTLVQAATGMAAEVLLPRPPGDARMLGAVIGGLRDARRVSVYRALIGRWGCSFGWHPPGLAEPANTTLARTREQMAGNRPWRNRPELDPWRALDCAYFLCSTQCLPEYGCVHLIVLTRPARDDPFDELDRRLVGLFHAELGRLWRRTDDEPACQLPRQLQRTLELLLEGASERQIASRLKLSPHTVHDHVKRLYLRFHVNTRAQLLVQRSHSALARAPRLCVNLRESDEDPRFDGVELTAAKPEVEASAGDALVARLRTARA